MALALTVIPELVSQHRSLPTAFKMPDAIVTDPPMETILAVKNDAEAMTTTTNAAGRILDDSRFIMRDVPTMKAADTHFRMQT
jgi:hypothetical protein